MFCFIRKIHESKREHPPSYFYKKHCEQKMKNIFALSNASKIKSNIYETNNRGSKMIWIPKVKTCIFIARMIYSLER